MLQAQSPVSKSKGVVLFVSQATVKQHRQQACLAGVGSFCRSTREGNSNPEFGVVSGFVGY